MHQPHDETSRSSSFNSCPPAAFNGQRGPLPSGVGKQTSASWVLFSSAWCSNLGCVPAQASSWGQACRELPQKVPRFWSSVGL